MLTKNMNNLRLVTGDESQSVTMKLGGEFITIIIIIISVASVPENSILNNIFSTKLKHPSVEFLLTRLISSAAERSTQCNVCNVVAATSIQSQCVRSRNCNEETAKLVRFHCVKA